MQYQSVYEPETLTREQLNAGQGLTLLEFGTNWCGYCVAAQGDIQSAIDGVSAGRHLKVEDGPGRPLGRSFRVKLWPTLIVMKEGEEVARAVRPDRDALARLVAAME